MNLLKHSLTHQQNSLIIEQENYIDIEMMREKID